jgi:hypothetical protein
MNFWLVLFAVVWLSLLVWLGYVTPSLRRGGRGVDSDSCLFSIGTQFQKWTTTYPATAIMLGFRSDNRL